jgi:hypothetical protein
MENKGSSKLMWIIGGLIVVAGGVGAYLLLRKPKEETGSEETNTDSDNNSDLGLGLSSGSETYTAPAELNTTDKIKAFQDWMDAQGKGWIMDKNTGKWKLLNKGAGYGTYGKNTDAVWKVYGVDYLKSLKTPSATTTPVSTLTPASASDISTIINFSTGTKAEKSSLSKANDDFVKTWAKAIRNKKKAFIWANQVYRTWTGDKVLDTNPINVNYYAKISGRIAKTSPDDSAPAYNIAKGTDLGKVRAISYNNGLWLYAPNSGLLYKWYKIDTITTKKPSSSFEGFTDEVEFASFDSNFDLNL